MILSKEILKRATGTLTIPTISGVYLMVHVESSLQF